MHVYQFYRVVVEVVVVVVVEVVVAIHQETKVMFAVCTKAHLKFLVQ